VEVDYLCFHAFSSRHTLQTFKNFISYVACLSCASVRQWGHLVFVIIWQIVTLYNFITQLSFIYEEMDFHDYSYCVVCLLAELLAKL